MVHWSRRMPTDEKKPTDETAEAFAAAKALAEAASNGTQDDPELESMRAELAASLAREEDLRVTLSEQLESREREVLIGHELAERAMELDQRAAKLAASEAD